MKEIKAGRWVSTNTAIFHMRSTRCFSNFVTLNSGAPCAQSLVSVQFDSTDKTRSAAVPMPSLDQSLVAAAMANGVDWTSEGKVSPVVTQGKCGACWSIGTTGAIESGYAITTGDLAANRY